MKSTTYPVMDKTCNEAIIKTAEQSYLHVCHEKDIFRFAWYDDRFKVICTGTVPDNGLAMQAFCENLLHRFHKEFAGLIDDKKTFLEAVNKMNWR